MREYLVSLDLRLLGCRLLKLESPTTRGSCSGCFTFLTSGIVSPAPAPPSSTTTSTFNIYYYCSLPSATIVDATITSSTTIPTDVLTIPLPSMTMTGGNVRTIHNSIAATAAVQYAGPQQNREEDQQQAAAVSLYEPMPRHWADVLLRRAMEWDVGSFKHHNNNKVAAVAKIKILGDNYASTDPRTTKDLYTSQVHPAAGRRRRV